LSTLPAVGRLTLRGGPEVEASLKTLLDEIVHRVSSVVAEEHVRALVLLGGYGRGEGGVVSEGGEERPHNNLDLLLASRALDVDGRRETQLKLDAALGPVARDARVGIDISIRDAGAIARDDCRVIWYDARHGHKTLLGDAGFFKGLKHFTAERILPSDALDLLVNRGTLLLINELLLARPGEVDRKPIVRHAAKAVIGYGDALLFFLGAYHWSYAERQKRMRGRKDVSERFRRLYEAAMEFRFSPVDALFAPPDLGEWTAALRKVLEPVHRRVESLRLGRELTHWGGYPEKAAARVLFEPGSPLDLARKVVRLLRGPGPRAGSLLARLGSRAAGPGAVLRAFYPVVAYGAGNAADRAFVREALEARSEERLALVRAYLRAWGRHRDTNLRLSLRRLGLEIEESAWA